MYLLLGWTHIEGEETTQLRPTTFSTDKTLLEPSIQLQQYTFRLKFRYIPMTK